MLVTTNHAVARIIRSPWEGVRPTAMGNAFIALADDHNAIWYNPAGLARTSGAHFNLFDLNLGWDNADTLQKIQKAIFAGDTASLLRQSSQFIRLGFCPLFWSRYFALGFYEHMQGFFDMSNLQSLDMKINVDGFNDIGAVTAFSIPAGRFFSFGMSIRVFQRSAIDINVTGEELIASLNPEDAANAQEALQKAAFSQLQKMLGLGWAIGMNIGVLARIPLLVDSPKWFVATTIEDIGQTNFRNFGILPRPKAIKPTYVVGTALRYSLAKKTELNLALDFRTTFEPMHFVKTVHFGSEFIWRTLAIRLGLYHGYPTYGLSFKVAPHTHLHFSSFAVEVGNNLWERYHRWFLVQIIVGFNPL